MSSSLDFLSRHDATLAPARRAPVWLLPAAILGGFAALFFTLYRDRLLPAAEVKVATVLTTAESNANKDASTPPVAAPAEPVLLFQASGWVEPDPYAVRAAALIDGTVASVHVLEGEKVEKRALIASLVDDDAKLKLAAAEGRLRMLTAERESLRAAVTSAASKKASAAAEVVAAETLESEAKDQLKRSEKLQGIAVSDSVVITERLRVSREQANLAAAKARFEEQTAEIARLEALAMTKDEETSLAKVAISQEKLALDRTSIRSPIAGRVLRLTAVPGEKKMLSMDHADSSTVAVLYDPANLQVRVDVPLADAARLQPGQKTKVHCNVLPDQVFEGEVTRITGEADLQRNTLQAKVRIKAPSDVLRPEMLCRVEFLGSSGGSESSQPKESGDLALWIPAEALSNNTVWVFDSDAGRISKRAVKGSTDKRDNYVRIQEGLNPGEQVVLSPGNMSEGQRIKPIFAQP